jgi:hypothetical protein
VLVGVDNLPGSVPIETAHLPRRCVLLFGQEGPACRRRPGAAALVCSIAQYGSNALDQRGRGQRDRHAHLDQAARRATTVHG